VKTTENSCRN